MYSLIDFKVMGDDRGKLVALEKGEDFPFDVKRVYYIWDSDKDVIRGKHAHKELEQVIVCLSGSCDFILDNGRERKTIHLDRADQGLYIKGTLWREFTNFCDNCIIMVLANKYYDPDDYIKEYNEFLTEAKECND